MKNLFITLIMTLFISSCEANSSKDTKREISNIEADQTIESLHLLINDYRILKGLRPLTINPSINEVALEHSIDMSSQKISFGHDGFTVRCKQIRETLGGGNLCLENVARGQKNAEQVFKAWINSSGHRENIESPRATHIGMGLSKDTKGSIYWTQIFLEL